LNVSCFYLGRYTVSSSGAILIKIIKTFLILYIKKGNKYTMATAKVDLLSKEELEDIVKSSRTLQEVLKKIGYSSVSGANRKTVQTRIDKYNISTAHFTIGVGKGIKRTEENVFCKNSTATQATLRKWYIKGNYTEYKCSICGQ